MSASTTADSDLASSANFESSLDDLKSSGLGAICRFVEKDCAGLDVTGVGAVTAKAGADSSVVANVERLDCWPLVAGWCC